jgi:hypothetical protein
VFNATVNNISVISWLSLLLVDELGENKNDWQIIKLTTRI